MIAKRVRGRPSSVIGWASLCKLMDEAELNNTELAQKMGVTRQTVGHWRRGKKAPDEPGIILLADILGGSPELLRKDCPGKRYRNKYTNGILNNTNTV